jgi:GDP-L-fucose synthase
LEIKNTNNFLDKRHANELMKKKRVAFITGHNGMVGSAILRLLSKKKIRIVTAEKKNLNLEDYKKTFNFIRKKKITEVYLCAAKVGGVYANTIYPVDFLEKNIQIQFNVIKASYKNNIKKMIVFGSSCVYPIKNRPLKESDFLSGTFEKTNESYALAKIAGIKLAESYTKQYPNKNLNYISVMPCNIFGPNDNYDNLNSHVMAALIKKIIIAKKTGQKNITIWGNGKSKREFLHVDELAKISYKLMNLGWKKLTKNLNNYKIINIGSGVDYEINKIAKMICRILKVKVVFKYDRSKPNGVKQKLLNIDLLKKLKLRSKIKFGTLLKKHVEDVYEKNNF